MPMPRWTNSLRRSLFLLVLCGSAGYAQDAVVASQQALVNRYCLGCHNDKLKSGSFHWAKVDLAHPAKSAEDLEKALHMLHAGMMPPPGIPRPDAGGDEELCRLHRNAHRPGGRRAAEPRKSGAAPAESEPNIIIRFATCWMWTWMSPRCFPPDDMSHGFDNMADVLTRFTGADGRIHSRGRAGSAGKRWGRSRGERTSARPITFRAWSVRCGMWKERRSERAAESSVIHDFPADGEYVFRMSLYYDICGPLWGKNQGKGQQIEVAVNGARVALMTIDPNSTFTDDLVTPPIKVKAGPQKRFGVVSPESRRAGGRFGDAVRAEPDRFQQRRSAGADVASAPARTAHRGAEERHRHFGNAQPAQDFHLPSGRARPMRFPARKKSSPRWRARRIAGR